MCGICVALFLQHDGDRKKLVLTEATCNHLRKRGPDHFNTKVKEHNENMDLVFYSSVLHMRGKDIVPQPCEDEHGNMLLFNGEIFGGSLYSDDSDAPDIISLSIALTNCDSDEDITTIFSGIKGPYAFLYYQPKRNQLWFGRDVIGRRSLLCCFSSDSLILSSVATEDYAFKEVPSDGIYCIDLETSNKEKCLVINKFPWTHTLSGYAVTVNCDSFSIRSVPSHLELRSPITSPINKTLPTQCLPTWELSNEELFSKLLTEHDYSEAVDNLESILNRAVELRLINMIDSCRYCYQDSDLKKECKDSKVAILFSGGLDSMIIAALADKYIPSDVPIDLLTVAFESPSKLTATSNRKRATLAQEKFDTPDRITGRTGLMELKLVNGNRTWNFVEIDVPIAELQNERDRSVSRLLVPSCTVLDDSIGCALWFAARGKGKLKIEDRETEYTSPARVVLVGMGADELLAGYSRHRVKFESSNWKGLIEEMAFELDRISSRNLGRDDRVISDHGREVRHPFLDEDVINFINQLPIWLKADLRYPRGVGEKLLLRLLAFKLGLSKTALLPKRAIQFGSRIARCENTKEKGSDVCKRLGNVHIS